MIKFKLFFMAYKAQDYWIKFKLFCMEYKAQGLLDQVQVILHGIQGPMTIGSSSSYSTWCTMPKDYWIKFKLFCIAYKAHHI